MSNAVSVALIACTLFSVLTTEGPPDPGLIQEVEPNFDIVKGLICYQCRSNSSELQPLCDETMFRLSTKQEKYNMSLQCPHYQGSYCFKKVTRQGKSTETIRGCSGPTDVNGNLMKSGCMTKENMVVCLCDEKFCNKANVVFPNLPVAVAFTALRFLT